MEDAFIHIFKSVFSEYGLAMFVLLSMVFWFGYKETKIRTEIKEMHEKHEERYLKLIEQTIDTGKGIKHALDLILERVK